MSDENKISESEHKPRRLRLSGKAPHLKAVYDYVCDYWEKYNISPTHADIADACFLSRGTVVRYLDRLEARGLITREPNIPRSIQVVKRGYRL